MTPSSGERKWWKEGTVYQIWPASYKDSNGDGIGDIPGIISTIDYLKNDLGVDIIWLSPMFDSPQVDMGYDISNYEDIYPPYGTLADMDALIKGCHDRGMRLLVDLVINHTSDLHEWFRQSRSSKTNSKRDWYIWRPARMVNGERQPPNNWAAILGGGSAWEWDEASQEYYLHLFAKEQPDLNWENPATRDAIYQSAVQFWLDRGVDGFRVDTANLYSKPSDFVDAPILDEGAKYQLANGVWCNGPRIHEYWQELGAKMAGRDLMTVGECGGVHEHPEVLAYVGASQEKMSMLFQFDLCELGRGGMDGLHQCQVTPWKLPQLKGPAIKWQQFVGIGDGWSTVFLENHDLGRSVSRLASDAPEHRANSAKMLAVYQATATGTLFLYQGQEIGMTNVPRSWPIDEYQDVGSQNLYKSELERYQGDPARMEEVMDYLRIFARDHARTPVQWNAAANAGFSSAKPWMRVNPNYVDVNVEQQLQDPNSVLGFYRRTLQLRKEYADLFVYGHIEGYDLENPATFTYTKEYQGRLALINLNFSSGSQPITNPLDGYPQPKLLISSAANPDAEKLAPWEGRVYLVESLPN